VSALLDRLLPDAGLAVRERRVVAAGGEQVFGALARMPARSVAGGRSALLRGLRAAGIRDPDGALHAQLLASGFVVLAADPLREVVIGRVIAPRARGRPARPLRGRGDFVAVTTAGAAKIALAIEVGEGTVDAEVRLRVVGLGVGARAVRPLARRGVAAFLDALERELSQSQRPRHSRRVT
jgi:hypothetical protein